MTCLYLAKINNFTFSPLVLVASRKVWGAICFLTLRCRKIYLQKICVLWSFWLKTSPKLYFCYNTFDNILSGQAQTSRISSFRHTHQCLKMAGCLHRLLLVKMCLTLVLPLLLMLQLWLSSMMNTERFV